MEKISYMIKFKQGDVEFKVSGDKEFVVDLFEQFKEMFNIKPSLKVSEEASLIIVNQNEKQKSFEEINKVEMPLDVYLNKFDTTGLQQKFLATALYLIEIKKQASFRSRDINNLLKDNNFEPFKSAATHVQRLREKGLISVRGKEGPESVITIYKDNMESAINYLKKHKDAS